jgi:DNA modification methylase
MQSQMSIAVNKNLNNTLKTKKVREFKEYKSENCNIQLGDCVELIKGVESESIGLSIFSPPFASLYTYSDELEDMGNSKDQNEFEIAFRFLVKELYRVMQSGRNVAVHCMDLPIQKGKEGYIGLRDFSGLIRSVFESEGFIYHSRVTIWKDPVVEMQRTKALGLLHKQVKKDAAMSRVGIPDYLLVFRKDGEHKNPVRCTIDVDTWQKYASPVWMDIDYGDTLNFTSARDEKDEKHICPLQLPTIKRAVTLWSNEGDKVLTPFMGVGSEVYLSIEMGRFGIGFELKESYFDVAVKNVKKAELLKTQVTLF